MKRILVLATAALVIGLSYWSPWVTEPLARRRAMNSFAAGQVGIADGCGFNCKGCGAIGARKVAFGYEVRIEYACGLLPADAPEYHKTGVFFVSPLGTVHPVRP